MAALLLAFAQAASQERSLESLARAFADGEEAARAPLLRAATYSVLPLRAARERSPKRVDALLFEIKAAAAGPGGAEAVRMLADRRSFLLGDMSFRDAWTELCPDLPILYDPTFNDEVLGKRLGIIRRDVLTWEVLDEIARAVGADWGFFWGRALFSRPERLWPAGPPPAIAALGLEDSARAARWIEQLDSDSLEERAAASDSLHRLGEPAIPLLEKAARGGKGEVAERCRELIVRRVPAGAMFREPAAASQKLAGADAELRKALREKTVTARVSYHPLDSFLEVALRPSKIPYDAAGAYAVTARLFTDFHREPAWIVLALVTQACGSDFRIVDGRVVVDPAK